METIENLAREKIIKKLRLQSSINAIDFYEKLGYTKGEKQEDRDYGITYIMIKKL